MEKRDELSCDAIFVQGSIRTSVFWKLGKDCERLPGLLPMRRLFPRMLWNEVVGGLLQRGNVVMKVPVMKGCGKEGIGECGGNGVENELRR